MAESQSSEAIRRQLEQLARDLDNQTAIQRDFGNTGEQAIGKSYEELGGKLQGNLGEIKGNINTGRTGVAGAYDTAQSNIGTAESTLQQLLGNQIDMSSGGFNSPLQEIQRLSAENATGKANSLGSFEQLGIGHVNAGQLAIGDAARIGTDKKADLKSQIAAEIGELQRNYLGERSAMEVQLAQVLDQERARQEEMALEREKMAQQARENALNRAASRGGKGDSGYGKGRAELMRWAAENKIPKKDLDLILKGINAAGVTGEYSDAYLTANQAVKGKSTKGGWKSPLGSAKNNIAKNIANMIKPPADLNTVNSGLDIYYGRY